MTLFLVDEDLPRSLAPELRRVGFDAEDVRDRGLGGRDDSEIVAYAVSHRRTLLTRDVGIADLRRFPAGSETGIVLVRFSHVMATHDLNAAIVAALQELMTSDFFGSIVVILPGRVRMRRRSS